MIIRFLVAAVLTVGVLVNPVSSFKAQAQPFDFVETVEKYSGAVVNISTKTKPKKIKNPMGNMRSPFEGTPFEDFFNGFLGEVPMQTMPRRSLGSGLIISADGYIVTNNHVVDGADEIVVRFKDDKEEVAAEIVGSDRKNDLTLLKIDTDRQLPTAPFGDSDNLKVGEWVLAIGNPFGLGGSVSAGIVSALSRNINVGPYDDFIQTDAAINPGNSGGPLFNAKGEVVGINTAILSRSGGNQGIGFAVPINTVKLIVEQIKEHGHPIRGWLGVRIQTVTPELAEALGLDEGIGALVAGVEDDSPAKRAGIKDGDVIVEFDNQRIQEMTELPKLVAQTEVGKEVDVVVIRDGKHRTLDVTIAQMEEDQIASSRNADENSMGAYGLNLATLTDERRQTYGIDDDVDGVLVTGVEVGSAAFEADIRRGDIIVSIDQKKVDDVKAAQDLLKGEKTKLILVNRAGTRLFAALKPQTDE